MSASGQIDYEWEDDEDGPHIAMVTYFYVGGSPGRTHGQPDDWSPPEPSEIDVTEIVVDGKVLDKVAEDAFLERHGDSLYEQIDDHETADYGEE